MRLPDSDAASAARIRYGGYLATRLRRAKRTQLAADVEAATAEVKQCARNLEDALLPVQEARAHRDAADDDLDDIAQDSRAKLAGRSADANKNAPYTLIFSEGIEYYTAAPLGQQRARYLQLAARLTEHLDADDEIRKTAVPAIHAGVDAFRVAADNVETALLAEAQASTRLQVAEEAWATLVTKVYGVLIAEVGKKGAERFFPKRNSKKNDAPE